MLPQEKSERATSLLTTKFYVPRFRTCRVSRPRLEDKLTKGLNRTLTLVSAAAGSGKSTLVGEWLCKQQLAADASVWLSLDEDDNDPVRFLTYLVAALHKIASETESPSPETCFPSGAADATASIKPSLTAAINHVASHTSQFVLVLDDYHVIESDAVHDAVTFLLDHGPRQLHLILIGRSDPPLPLSRLRAGGELMEIRDGDLAFTAKETAVFLSDVMGLELAPEQVSTLHRRSEGWITGLQLAALSIQELVDHKVISFIDTFSGSHRHVMDYLVEEILNHHPPHVETFLLDTSVLDRFCAPLCDAIMADRQSEHSRSVLAHLESSNMFLVPLDSERHWYRYHHLFADFLHHRLQQEQPDRLPTLHRRASDWYEQEELVEDALRHALLAQDFERAITLLLDYRIPDTLFRRGENATLHKWLQALPDELIRERPLLCLAYAWTLTLNHQLDRVDTYLDRAESYQGEQAGTQIELRQRVQSNINTIRSEVALRRGQIGLVAKYAQQALADLPDGAPGLHSIAALNLGIAHLLQGETERAEQVLTDARQASLAASHLHVNTSTLCTLARLREQQGQLHQAAHLYRHAIRIADQNAGGDSTPLATAACIGLAELHRERDELDVALAYLDDSFTAKELQGSAYDLKRSVALARIKQAQGDSEEALQTLYQAERVAHRHQSVLDVALVKAWQARFHLAQGNLSAAQQSLQSVTEKLSLFHPKNDFLLPQRETVYTTQVRICIAQGGAEAETTLSTLDKLLEAATAAGRTASVLELLVLKARAHQALADLPNALATIQRALALAEPNGYIRLFVDEGAPMAALLQRVTAPGRVGRYALQILTAFPHSEGATTEDGPTAENRPWTLVESLSQRELEVLQLLAAGLPNREIAQQLVIAVETVRWHTKNIYRKLAVRNRTQAAVRAQDLGLLSSS